MPKTWLVDCATTEGQSKSFVAPTSSVLLLLQDPPSIELRVDRRVQVHERIEASSQPRVDAIMLGVLIGTLLGQ